MEPLQSPIVILSTVSGTSIFMFDPLLREQVDIIDYIDNFKYEYDEEDSDLCDITFSVPNGDLKTIPELQKGRTLYVQWGSLNSLGPKRLVCIRDWESDYRSNGCLLTMKCSDHASYLKGVRNLEEESDLNLDKYLKKTSEKGIAISIEINGKTFYKASNGKLVSPEDISVIETNISGYAETAYKTLKTDREREAFLLSQEYINNSDSPEMGTLKAFDAIAGFIWDVFKPKLTATLEPDQIMSITDTLKKRVDSLPGGPYLVDGRDNSLTIHNRNMVQYPRKNMTYGPNGIGEVISVKLKTHDAADSASIAQVNSESNEDKVHSVITKYCTKIIDDLSDGADDVMKEAHLILKNKLINTVERSMTSTDSTGSVRMEPPEISVMKANNQFPAYLNQDKRKLVEAIDNARVPSYFKLSGSLALISALGGADAEYQLDNKLRQVMDAQAEIEMTSIGDPNLKSSIVVYIDGLSQVDNGRYYLKKVIHNISRNNGYKIESEGYKVMESYYYNKSNVDITTNDDGTYTTNSGEIKSNVLKDIPDLKAFISNLKNDKTKVNNSNKGNKIIKASDS